MEHSHTRTDTHTQTEYYVCFWKTVEDKCMYHTLQESKGVGVCTLVPVNKREVSNDVWKRSCNLSSPTTPTLDIKTHTYTRTQASRNEQCPKMHQQGPRIETLSNIPVPFVSIGWLSAWSVLGSQWEYRTECSFLHLLSLTILSISLTFVALLHWTRYNTSFTVQSNNMPLQFSAMLPIKLTSVDIYTKQIDLEQLGSWVQYSSEPQRSKTHHFGQYTSQITKPERANAGVSQFNLDYVGLVQLSSVHFMRVQFRLSTRKRNYIANCVRAFNAWKITENTDVLKNNGFLIERWWRGKSFPVLSNRRNHPFYITEKLWRRCFFFFSIDPPLCPQAKCQKMSRRCPHVKFIHNEKKYVSL